MYLAAGKNALYANKAAPARMILPPKPANSFQAQTNLMAYFNHTFAGGKWNHFMDQTYIGYTSWDGPPRNNLGAGSRWPKSSFRTRRRWAWRLKDRKQRQRNGDISLPPFDFFNQQHCSVDVFNQGKTGFAFTTTASAPWIVLSETAGQVEKEKRLWVSVDWSKAQTGTNAGEIKISGAGGTVSVKVEAFNPSEPARDSLQGFVEGDGCVSMEAEHFTGNLDSGANRWIKIPGYGHTLSAMRADGPADVLAMPGKDSPCLEYKMYLFHTGKIEVQSTVGPTLNFLPGRPLRYAVSFDDETPQTVTIVPANFNAHWSNEDWSESVKNNCRHVQSIHTIAAPGYHTLKIWMVDPAVAVEKIVVNTGGIRPSYLGPPESFHQ